MSFFMQLTWHGIYQYDKQTFVKNFMSADSLTNSSKSRALSGTWFISIIILISINFEVERSFELSWVSLILSEDRWSICESIGKNMSLVSFCTKSKLQKLFSEKNSVWNCIAFPYQLAHKLENIVVETYSFSKKVHAYRNTLGVVCFDYSWMVEY